MTESVSIGTHSGTFHCDEALACFLLHQLPQVHSLFYPLPPPVLCPELTLLSFPPCFLSLHAPLFLLVAFILCFCFVLDVCLCFIGIIISVQGSSGDSLA
jgi:Uncharacterised protein family (UPF0160)